MSVPFNHTVVYDIAPSISRKIDLPEAFSSRAKVMPSLASSSRPIL